MKSSQAIGVFDSGVGGLSVLTHIHHLLPGENLCYVADSAFMPYGCKSAALVEERCMKIARFFIEQKCKAIVVACNTATAVAVHSIRELYDIPVIGMEPALKPAVVHSASGVVGVLATSGTLGSDKFQQLKNRYAKGAELIVQPCPGLVEVIEKGDLDALAIRSLLEVYLKPLLDKQVDTLVLGCTHYPFISQLISELAGESVRVIDTGEAISRELKRQLAAHDLAVTSEQQADLCFWSSSRNSEAVIARLWGESVIVGQLDF